MSRCRRRSTTAPAPPSSGCVRRATARTCAGNYCRPRRRTDMNFADDTPVYVISVAAQLSGLHPQTLRTYDRMGLVSPGRTAGRGRRYSMRDIAMLQEIQRLSQEEGINLAGI